MKSISGKTVILTGASGGIGVYIARTLAQEHATIVCLSRSQKNLEKICNEIKKAGGQAIPISFDIKNLTELPNLIQHIKYKVGSIDIIINNAAIEKFRAFEYYTLEDIQSILTTNLTAPMELTRLVLPEMLERSCGHIVNIASGSGKKGAPYNSVYSASKAGLIMWSDALRQELANTNIGVSVICPGVTDAGMYHALDITAPSAAKIAHPQEVATAVIQAIKQNHKEVILDGLKLKFLFALSQFFPKFGDWVFQQVGVVELNQKCATKQMNKVMVKVASKN